MFRIPKTLFLLGVETARFRQEIKYSDDEGYLCSSD